jgi:D-xylose 1-dehydrogenase (NADP+, D-xylono-1,5-lactone-forming)
VSSDDPVRWGILSTARINAKFLRGTREAPSVELLAVASRDEERARSYAREQAIPRAYGSYDALLADPDVEALYISLPNALHVPWTIRALEAGKHVLCEKPMARRMREAERVVKVARERGRLFSEAFMYRHHPQIRRLEQLLAEGAVGELRVVRAQFSFPIQSAADVRLSSAMEGGALMDVGCYCVHAARTLAGEPSRVAAMRVTAADGIDMRFTGVMQLPAGVLAHFDAGFDFADRSELEVVGSQASVVLSDPWHGVTPAIELRRRESAEAVAVETANPYGREAENFSAAVRGRGELLLDGEDAIAQASAIEALYAAAESGRTVMLSSGRR